VCVSVPGRVLSGLLVVRSWWQCEVLLLWWWSQELATHGWTMDWTPALVPSLSAPADETNYTTTTCPGMLFLQVILWNILLHCVLWYVTPNQLIVSDLASQLHVHSVAISCYIVQYLLLHTFHLQVMCSVMTYRHTPSQQIVCQALQSVILSVDYHMHVL